MFADAVVSASGNDFVLGLDQNEFHTFRFETVDGINYRFSVDGFTFSNRTDNQSDNGSHFVQLGGRGGCDLTLIPRVNKWDFVRYGTISTGEFIIASDPPPGFLDPAEHASLDRFTVTFDQPNYLYIEQITVETSAVPPPAVLQTRRRENDGPETIEIVLDRPLPIGEPIRFIFDDGTTVNYVEYNSGSAIAGPIPTVSHWGLTSLALLLLAAATILVHRMRPTTNSQ